MASMLIQGGKIWDGDRFFYGDILVEDGRIAQIAERIECTATRIYDARGKLVTPGLVDGHVHLRGVSSDIYGIPADSTCFPFGVTAAVDAGTSKGTPAMLDAAMVKTAVFLSAPVKENQANLEKLQTLLDTFGRKAIGVKVYCSAPNVVDVTPLQAACEFAKERGLLVMVHCTDSPIPMKEIVQTLSAGDILTHAFHREPNSAAADDFAALKLAKEKGVVVDAGFAGHVHTDFAVFRGALAAGITPDIISTDITRSSAFLRGGRYGMTMCLNMARAAGMTEEDTLRCATSAPAGVFGMKDRWGRLAEGRVADLAVLEDTDEGFCLTDKAGNVLESKTGYRCRMTVADGDVVYKI